LVQRLTAIFEATFSESSWGYRPGRSAQQAVKAAQSYLKEGKDWVVDLDIEKFFDRVNHDILMTRIGKIIRDKRVLSLIGKFLRAGVMVEGVVIESVEGTPQGGPLSPLLSNLYLTPLDEELERRGLSFCRFADDSNIYVGSEAAAQRIRTGIQQWIEKHLRLKVNVSKSGYGRPWERKFLGFSFTKRGEIAVAPQSLARLRQRVRQLWDSRQGKTSEQLRKQWQDYIIGWWNYFKLAQWRQEVFNCEGWIRRHIRKCFWLRWHNKRGRLRKLRRLGVYGPPLQIAGSSRGAWPVAATPTLQWAMSNARLRQYHFWVPSDLAKLKP
jgi:group II intron reverse transcriptase/maturase